MRIKQTLCAGAIAMAVATSAASTFFDAVGTARAPEPARPNSTWYSTSWQIGATYVSSQVPTTIVRLTSSWTSTTIPAGTPCTTSSSTMYPTSTVTTVVIRNGNLGTCR